MTIDELIERLEDYRDVIGGDAEVRLMTQQHWPFENGIVGLASGEEINADDGDVDTDHVVYIVEGQQLSYGTERAWQIVPPFVKKRWLSRRGSASVPAIPGPRYLPPFAAVSSVEMPSMLDHA